MNAQRPRPAAPPSHRHPQRRRSRRARAAGATLTLFLTALALSARAVVIPNNTDDASFVQAGLTASNAGRLGAVEGHYQSGAVGYSSMTMLTDFRGRHFPIMPLPDHTVVLELGGFGQHGETGERGLPQDGKPRLGSAPTTSVPPFVNSSYFAGTVFFPDEYGITTVGAAPGDSGGLVGYNGGVLGVISAFNGTDVGSKTLFSRLSPASDWINTNTAGGGIWGVTAAHVAQNFDDPVTLTSVAFGDYTHPFAAYNVTRVIVYPGSTSSGTRVDFAHPDLALLQLIPSPDPSTVALALPALALLMLTRGPRLAGERGACPSVRRKSNLGASPSPRLRRSPAPRCCPPLAQP
ncbi:MAG TPA: hypothetical protein VLJ39_09630 [Tepidisphaeraceae bacterium]|nr:hypothetical protein [Tepidisphaeraceae bacterium]